MISNHKDDSMEVFTPKIIMKYIKQMRQGVKNVLVDIKEELVFLKL